MLSTCKLLCTLQHVQEYECQVHQVVLLYPVAAVVADWELIALPALHAALVPLRHCPPGPSGVSRFMPTSRRLVQFSEGKSAPEGSTIVYIDGAFDVFHAGHVEILRVGVGTFDTVSLDWQAAQKVVVGPVTPAESCRLNYWREVAVEVCLQQLPEDNSTLLKWNRGEGEACTDCCCCCCCCCCGLGNL
jgi:hypothetical protein